MIVVMWRLGVDRVKDVKRQMDKAREEKDENNCSLYT